ncbi:MAG: hypothetical protein ABFD51_11655 [Anaerolineaceae bacterium]
MLHSIHSPYEAPIIESLQYQGHTNDCAPFTIATIIKAFNGIIINGSELARKMDKPIWRGNYLSIRRIPHWATFPWGMVDVFREYGFEANWGFFYSTDKLRQNLENGMISIPVLCSLKPFGAHVMTLLAWHPAEGWGFANTQSFAHELYWVSNRQLMKQWNLSGRLLIEVQAPISNSK